MAQVKGIYGDGTGSKKKKKDEEKETGRERKVTETPVAKSPERKTPSNNVPAQSTEEARREQRREQAYRAQQGKPAESASSDKKVKADSTQSTNAAKQEQLREQQYRREMERMAREQRAKSVSAKVAREEQQAAMKRAVQNRQPKQVSRPVTDEEFDRIWYEDDPRYQRAQKLKYLQREKTPEEAAFDLLWYEDDPDYTRAHRDADSARAEQRAAREYQTQREQAEREQMARDSSVESAREEQLAAQKYLEQREREQKAYDLSTEAAIDEKLAMRAQVAIQSNLEYTENIWDRAYGVIDKWSQNDPSNKELLDQVDKWVSENIRTTSAVQEGWTEIEDTEQLIHAVEDFFQSRDSEYPMQVQFVVDTEEEMAVCRMIHLGKIGLDMYEVFKLASKGIAVTAASVSTLGFGAVLGAAFLGAATKKGISLATDIAYAIQDEMTYKETGQVIVTMGIESKSPVGKLAYALF